MDLSAAKDDSNSEVQAKVRLAREKEHLQAEHNELKEKFKVRTYIRPLGAPPHPHHIDLFITHHDLSLSHDSHMTCSYHMVLSHDYHMT